MTGLDLRQVHDYVIVPAVDHLDMNSLAARRLLLLTGMRESHFRYLDQIDAGNRPGPAYGLWQMEKATARDIDINFLRYRPALAARMEALRVAGWGLAEQLRWNLLLACAYARLQYYRRPEALPPADDPVGLAGYYKQWFNSFAGKSTIADTLPHARRAIEVIRE